MKVHRLSHNNASCRLFLRTAMSVIDLQTLVCISLSKYELKLYGCSFDVPSSLTILVSCQIRGRYATSPSCFRLASVIEVHDMQLYLC